MAPAAIHDDAEANQNTIFIDSSLDTHLATIVPDSDTVSDLKRKIMLEHRQCYPDIGDIRIECLKVKRRGVFYRLPDSMPIKSAFQAAKRNWYASVDVSRLERDGNTQHMERQTVGDQLALPWVTDSHSIDKHDSHEDIRLDFKVHDQPVSVEINNSKKRKRVMYNTKSLREDASWKKKRKTQKVEGNVNVPEEKLVLTVYTDKVKYIGASTSNENSFEHESKSKDLSDEKGEKFSALDQLAIVVPSSVKDAARKSIEASENVSDVAMVEDNNMLLEMATGTSQKERENQLVLKAVVLENEIPSSPMTPCVGTPGGRRMKCSKIKAAEKEVSCTSSTEKLHNTEADSNHSSQQDLGSIVQQSWGMIKHKKDKGKPHNINEDAVDSSEKDLGPTVLESADDEIGMYKQQQARGEGKKIKSKRSCATNKDESLVKHAINVPKDQSHEIDFKNYFISGHQPNQIAYIEDVKDSAQSGMQNKPKRKTKQPQVVETPRNKEQEDIANIDENSKESKMINVDLPTKIDTDNGPSSSRSESFGKTFHNRQGNKPKFVSVQTQVNTMTEYPMLLNTPETIVGNDTAESANAAVNSDLITFGDKVPGTTATDTTTASKNKKRQRSNKMKLASSDITVTPDMTQDMVIANNKTQVKEIIRAVTCRKKLLIFDLNGLLADVVFSPSKGIKADKVIAKRAIFKRPFLDDFMCFCLERFDVAIWSSRSGKVLNPILDFLLGDLKEKLLFCWDASKCTNTGMKTLEDKHKYLVLKDLTKIWETNGDCNSWVKGTFDESNTLLLDDSPYKALLNPKHTGIFPVSYSYKNKDDDSLGPKGALRTYLEALASTDNVKTYVEQHPFGQSPIDEKNPNFSFYSRALKSLGTK